MLFGVIAPLLIGVLHSYAHFSDLLTSEIRNTLDENIPIFGEPTLMFNTWGLMSFMMGGAFMIIGLLNLVTYSRLKKNEAPPVGSLLTMMLYLLFVIYAAYTFSATPQLYGGVIGLIAMGVALFSGTKSTT